MVTLEQSSMSNWKILPFSYFQCLQFHVTASKTLISDALEKKMIIKICIFSIFEYGSDLGNEHYLSSNEFFFQALFSLLLR